MGWWSAHIDGGDSPLDALAGIADVCEVPFDENKEGTYHCYPFTKESLQNNKKSLEDYLKSDKVYYRSISYQLVGLLLMRFGVKINKRFKNKIISETKKDDWYNECLKAGSKNQERIIEIEGFLKQFKKFDGTSRYIPKDDDDGEEIYGEYICIDPQSVQFIKE